MTRRIIFFSFVFLLAGLALGWIWNPFRRQMSIAEHWNLVNAYRAFERDAANYKFDPQTGLMAATMPPFPLPSLAELKAAGEVEYIDIVLPNVPKNRRMNRHWMQFTNSRNDILFASGNPEYTDYQPSGNAPLHLQLWFKKNVKGDVQQLIKDLETLATTQGTDD
jgi:hypothetical protein